MTYVLNVAGIILVSLSTTQTVAEPSWTAKRIIGMDYPPLASRARIEGKVEVACEINPDGSVAASAAVGNPQPLLSKPALENALKWIFVKNPAATDRSTTVVLTYTFKMEGKGSDWPRSQFVFEYPNTVFVTSDYWNLNVGSKPPPVKK